ncbi:MAG: hypothetical protein IPK83_13755 [Planctomycetes bacterium]|nr:hypothetical protein [Planctomycetota bacterium]
MPASSYIENPVLGYAAYSAVKFIGYTLFASWIPGFYRKQGRETIQVDANGQIDDDLICSRCKYQLRGLGASARCPECDMSVAESLNDPYRSRVGDPDANPYLAGAVRTFIGMALGYVLYGISQLLPAIPLAVGIILLLPVRFAEWALLLYLFYDRTWSRKAVNERIIMRGVLLSFLLDLPAAMGFCLVSYRLSIC